MSESTATGAVREADVAIVGGGAAGLMTAIVASRISGAGVAVLDGAPRLGAKILISGGGRCNVTNRAVGAADFNGGSRNVIGRVLKALPVAETIAFFGALGVSLHEEQDGKLFPDSERAVTVLDALVGAARASGATLLTQHRVHGIEKRAAGFDLATSGGPVRASRVVLATGGLSVPKTGSDGLGFELSRSLGHTVVATSPALVPLLLGGDAHAKLAGVTHRVTLYLAVDGRRRAQATGSLLWTHFGVSGPAPLDISRHWHRAVLEGHTPGLHANLRPGETFEQVDAELLAAGTARPRASLATIVSRLLPAAVATHVVEYTGAEGATPMAHVPRDTRRCVAHAIAALPLPVSGSRGFAVAEATAGGVSLDEVDASTLESRVCPGLYLVGEVLDVDGRLGGFNFQWAWASGTAAGRALARSFQ